VLGGAGSRSPAAGCTFEQAWETALATALRAASAHERAEWAPGDPTARAGSPCCQRGRLSYATSAPLAVGSPRCRFQRSDIRGRLPRRDRAAASGGTRHAGTSRSSPALTGQSGQRTRSLSGSSRPGKQWADALLQRSPERSSKDWATWEDLPRPGTTQTVAYVSSRCLALRARVPPVMANDVKPGSSCSRRSTRRSRCRSAPTPGGGFCASESHLRVGGGVPHVTPSAGARSGRCEPKESGVRPLVASEQGDLLG
jgi:hypothetical protein